MTKSITRKAIEKGQIKFGKYKDKGKWMQSLWSNEQAFKDMISLCTVGNADVLIKLARKAKKDPEKLTRHELSLAIQIIDQWLYLAEARELAVTT